MLVDNAIVIVEGMLIAMQKGKDNMQAAKEVVSQTAIPLLGSTAISGAGLWRHRSLAGCDR